jgi:hypothetical protein
VANTEVTPKACRFGPARESAQAIIAAALGETCLSATDWLSLCRSDPAVLLAWLGHDEVSEALPILPGDSNGGSNKRRHSKLDESSSRNAWHILARWADWQPTWFPDWSQPRLSGFRQAHSPGRNAGPTGGTATRSATRPGRSSGSDCGHRSVSYRSEEGRQADFRRRLDSAGRSLVFTPIAAANLEPT